MATNLWEQEIDKTVDWGGDNSTGGAAVSGQYVQKFIKDTLAKKFGYLHYDRTALKYFVFADEEDSKKYLNDTTGDYANLLLATFDAPAPASIQMVQEMMSNQIVTIISSQKNQAIEFGYIVKDSSNNPITESIQARIQFNNAGTIQNVIRTFAVDFDNYGTGTKQSIVIDDYLTVGTNNITITLTGLTTQATTTITFQYTVVELTITSTFDNKQAIVVDESKGTMDNKFSVPYQINGNGTKYMSWWVNGKQLHQKDWVDPSLEPQDGAFQATNMESYTSQMIIYLTNEMGELNSQFHYGKNTLQFYTYITYTENGIEKQILSEIKYYDFVIISKQSTAEETYILFSQDINSGVVFKPEDTIEFSTTQYSSTSFKYGLYSSSGMAVNLNFELSKTDETTGTKEVIANLVRSISSGEEQVFEYSFLTYGNIDIIITTSSTDSSGNPLDTLHIVVDVAKSSVQIEVTKDQLILNLEALNRSNTEPNPATWEFRDIKAEFKNVLWNSTSGWDGKALVLNGGATCEIPMNVFNYYGGAGLTFEVDFEMVNVQDEDAVVLSLRDKNNRSFIEFTACAATMSDGNLELNTNFIDNRKMKVALIFNPDGNPIPEEKKYYSTMMIIVDGIMDRVLNQSANNIKWVDAENPRIIIGDPNAKAGIKVNSIRVYQKALTFDEELTNWIAESNDMLGNYNKNNVCAEGSSDISLDIVKNMAPTMVVYGDTDLLDNAKNKSNNIEGDVEFYDPFEPELDFFARGAWISCQGTSSMMYPKKNWRLYFSKKPDDKTLDQSKPSDKMHWTEVYLNGEFTHGETNDFTKLGNFYCNKKTTEHKDSEGEKIYFHRLYCPAQAEELEKRGDLLYYKSGKDFLPCSFGDESALAAGEVYYVAAYRPLKDWLMVKEFRYSGCTLWKISGYSTVVNEYTGVEYQVPKYKKVKGKEALKEDTTYYVEQACWKQTAGSGWANRWTLKTDYAESSMCHNSGIARLWGNALKNFSTSAGYEGRTGAQNAMGEIKDGIDIRTSCDGKPIYMFACPIKRDDAGNPVYDENGLRQYEPAHFVGQFNIMTDKGSTALFGFEDIYDEKGNKIFSAENVECWEGSNNDDPILKFKTLVSEKVGNLDMGYRPIMASSWEPRWPDVEIEMSDGDEALVSHTMGLERLIRFLNFCMPAVRYTIDGSDGYNVSQYIKIEEEEYQTYVDNKIILYAPTADSVETGSGLEYEVVQYTTVDDLYAAGSNGIYYKTALDMTKVVRELSDEKIESKIYKGKIATFDAKHGFYVEDLPFDDARVDEEAGPNYGDPIKGSQYEEDYYTEVYLIQEGGNKFKYIDEYGDKKDFTGIRYDDEERNSKGESFAGKTYMEYFSEKKYDYFDIPKLAAYYVYIMRFCGVDQTVKNTMLTTEDGIHYYYINYDNDTTLGVRNDGQIVYHWTCDRTTYDTVKVRAAYAGDDSVLWNLLEMDEEFMNVVRKVDNALYSSNVLSTKIVVDYLNTKQKDVWCERTYNKQEERKYLSTWTSAKDPGYLKFCHGARDAHRTWFVTNRFNLFDSMWFSGEFNNHAFKFYVDITDATAQNPKDFFNITAARKAVFGVTTSDLDGVVPDDWKIDLEMNETTLVKSIRSLNIISGPASMLGVDKIKTLDFSPLINGGSNLGQFIFDANHSEWWDAKGIMMTKLIFGVSDEYRTTLKHGYTNTTANPIEMMFGKDTVIIEPGKRYDSDIEVNNAPAGVEHTMLYPTRNNVYNLGSLNALRTLEELDIRNCFNDNPTYHYNDLEINGLVNLHVYRAIGSSITTFRPAEGCILNEVSLPVNRIEAIELNNCSFVKLEDTYVYTNTTNKDITFMVGETEVKIKAFDTYKDVNDIEELPAGITKEFVVSPELFKYTPDAILKELILKNVSGLDVKDMIDKWLEALTNAGIGVSPETGKIAGRTLTLQNVNLTDVPVDWVLNTITKFNYTAFTGKVKLIGSGEDGTLTEPEYNAIVDQYGINVFNPTSNLVFDAPEGVFWTVTGAELVTLDGTNEDRRPTGLSSTVESFYSATHGVEYTVKATIFPISTSNKVSYKQIVYNGGKFDTALTKVDSTTGAATVNVLNSLDSTMINNNGVGKFTSTVRNVQMNKDVLYTIQVEVDGKANSSRIYINFDKIVLPTVINTVTTIGDEIVETPDNKLTITKEQTHKIQLAFKEGETSSLDVDQFSVSMDNNTMGNTAMQIVNVTKSNKFDECYFEIVPTIQDSDVTGNVVVNINFKSEYNVAAQGLELTIPVTVHTIPITDFTIYQITGVDENGNEVLSENPLTITQYEEVNSQTGKKEKINKFDLPLRVIGTTNYRICPIPEDYNVKVSQILLDNGGEIIDYTTITMDEEDNTKMTVVIKDNKEKSFDDEYDLSMTLVPIYDNDINKQIDKIMHVDASIIYPNYFELRQDVRYPESSIEHNISLMNDNSVFDGDFYFHIYNIDESDEVTYPYSIKFKNESIVTHDYVGEHGPQFTLIKNGETPVGVHVFIPSLNGGSDKIECSLDMYLEYNIGTNVKKVERNIKFTINRTLAFASSINDIDVSIFETGEPTCLLIDNNGNYYKLDKENKLLNSLYNVEQLNNLVGVVYMDPNHIATDPVKAISIPLNDLSSFIDNKFAMWWETNIQYGSSGQLANHVNWDNVYSQSEYLFYQYVHSGDGVGGNVTYRLYAANVGKNVSASNGLNVNAWTPGRVLTEALCENKWGTSNNGAADAINYVNQYKNRNYNFIDVDNACTPIGNDNTLLAIPNIYQFFKNYFVNPFTGEQTQIDNIKCCIGSTEEYTLLDRGFENIIEYLNDYLINPLVSMGLVDSSNFISNTLENIIKTDKDANGNNVIRKYLTSSLKSSQTSNTEFNRLVINTAKTTLFTNTDGVKYGSSDNATNMNSKCNIIPFIILN